MNELTGRMAEVHFETGYHFKLEYLEDDKLRFTSLGGPLEAGATETVPIYVHKIADGKYNVNWIESTGTSVTHIIDINGGVIWAFMSWGDDTAYGKRATLTHKGAYRLVNDDMSDDANPFTDAQRVVAYLNAVFNEKDLAKAEQFWADGMVQHNPTMPNGLDVLRGFIGQADPNLKYEAGKVLSDGDIISIHGRYLNWAGKNMIAVDYFKVVDGKFVEHWDVMQEEVTAEQSVNGNLMFPIQ